MLPGNRPKVLFLPKWYPDRKGDQNGNFVQQHAQAVAKFADVVVLYANADDFSGPDLIQFEFKKDGGIPTLLFYYKKHITGLGFIDKPLKLVLYFVCLMRGYRISERLFGRPDLLHVHVLLRTGLFAWFKCLTENLPFIITEHWTIYLPQNAHKLSWLRKKLTQLVVKKADALHTVSENLMQAMEKLGCQNDFKVVIPNVADTRTFYPENPTVFRPKKQLLHVAAFNEEAKNLSGLLRTVKKLSEVRQDFELRIVGFGPAEKQVKKLAQDLGLMNTFVFFEGKKETLEVAAYMRRADVFVLFSNFENLPCVLIEALASGIPVVATKVGGVAEMISEEQGMLVAPRDEAGLLKVLQFMLDHHQDFSKEKLHQYAEARFSYEAVGQAFAELYEKVLDQTSRKI